MHRERFSRFEESADVPKLSWPLTVLLLLVVCVRLDLDLVTATAR
jgi:hypothetical protein